MEFKKVIQSRRSIKNYKDKKVSWTLVSEILESALYAPSSGNIQSYKFIIVTDEKKKKEIANASIKQSWMKSAPIHIIICSDISYLKKFYNKKSSFYSTQNCSLVAENILLTITSLNLSGCFVSAFDREEVKKILKVPDHIEPEIIITIGYPDEKPSLQKKTHLEDLIFFEEYGNRERDINLFPLKKK